MSLAFLKQSDLLAINIYLKLKEMRPTYVYLNYAPVLPFWAFWPRQGVEKAPVIPKRSLHGVRTT